MEKFKLTALILLLVMVFAQCNEDDEPSASKAGDETPEVPNEKPPFTEFWFSTNFDLPSTTAGTFTKLTYFNVWGVMHGEISPNNNTYSYLLSNAANPSTLPANTTLTISRNSNDLIIKSVGKMIRNGSSVSPKYSGSVSFWNPEDVEYTIDITADVTAKTIKSASLKFVSTSYQYTYDLKSIVAFSENFYGPEWLITSNQIALDNFQIFLINFSINDVYGTAIKN